MKKILKRDYSGMTMVETVVALLLMGFALIVMGRLTSVRIAQETNLMNQQTVWSADSLLYSIYTDYHSCKDLSVERDNFTGVVTLTFDKGASGANVYQFDPLERAVFVNGSSMLECAGFTAEGNTQMLYVSVKLKGEQRLECRLYP